MVRPPTIAVTGARSLRYQHKAAKLTPNTDARSIVGGL
ncbi:hypothetical protein BDFB_005145 [Asbolus verrucosus]|uniref:Uncharacterized protein n=1 Tax=Asbolus verrucosus TaxID=1661398 RepID=A0A482W4Z4_ASBVE|nr:hypothetical protein BDFB_005145 [Asbolus verrucosus]